MEHKETECGHFCKYHQQYECEMITGSKDGFAVDDENQMEEHILQEAFKEYQTKSKSRVHLSCLQEIIHLYIDDC